MTRDEAAAKIKKCLRHLRAVDECAEKHPVNWRISRPRDLPPSYLRFVLEDLLGLSCEWQPFDKIRWLVEATFHNYPIVLEDRKLGLALGVSTEMPADVEAELRKRLRGSLRILEQHLRAVSRQRVEEGRFTVKSEFGKHDNAYHFFRDRAAEAYAAPPPPPVVEHHSDGGSTSSYDFAKPAREGGYLTVAMVHEFFSRLEHLLVLVLPALPNFDPAGGRLRSLMSANWKEKFKTAFDVKTDQRAKEVFDELTALKLSLRNPKAHGGFLPDGDSAWFHYEGIGALPMDLLDHNFKFFADVPSTDYSKACVLFDRTDALFREHSRIGCWMIAIDAGLDPAFDPQSLQEYRQAMASSIKSGEYDDFQRYVDGEIEAFDARMNYEF